MNNLPNKLNITNFEVTRHSMTLPFRNAARDNTVDIPRKLSVPCPAILSHDALITMASVPAARGDDITAYALLPEIVWQTLINNTQAIENENSPLCSY